MKRHKIALNVISIMVLFLSFIACDSDFVDIESDIINNDIATNFDVLSETYGIITYTEPLGPVQTNNLTLNTLGIYDDSYGRTTANFVSQLSLSAFDPDFGEEAVVDSVVLSIPYFSTATAIDESGNFSYAIDSVLGRDDLRLRLFESNFFLRSFDPTGSLGQSQAYFSDQSLSASEFIDDASLESEEISFVTGMGTSYPSDVNGDNVISISDEGFILTETDEEGETQVASRLPPGLRIKLDPDYWQNKIINQQGQTVLENADSFQNYLRGLYFKVEPVNDQGSYLLLNLSNQSTAAITIHYTRLTPSDTDDEEETNQSTFQMTFGPNRVNFMKNDFAEPITSGDPETGDSRLELKGGEGSIARVKLFNGDDVNDGSDTTFDDWKSFFVETEDGKFVRSKRLINEANLVFYVDKEAMLEGEPDRLYLYDVENNTPLIDYILDGINPSIPSVSAINHLVPLEREEDDPDGAGIKYKIRITEHINNLLLRDSTNVELGLGVALNVNLNQNRRVRDADNPNFVVPLSTIQSPRGTVLHGNASEDENLRVRLELFYTERTPN